MHSPQIGFYNAGTRCRSSVPEAGVTATKLGGGENSGPADGGWFTGRGLTGARSCDVDRGDHHRINWPSRPVRTLAIASTTVPAGLVGDLTEDGVPAVGDAGWVRR